jgi:hypothetical protein
MFKIFEKKRGIYISPANIVAVSWADLIFLIYYLKESLVFYYKINFIN